MANSRSSKKRIRQNVTNQTRNKAYKSTVRTAVKTFEMAVKEGAKASPADKFLKMQKLLDTAARKGYYHKNAVARKLSRMAKRLKTVQA